MSDKILISGNEAISLGAIAGGMKLYIAYPMTPSTGILHFLAKNALKAKISVRHAEDEIGVINMAIGAAFNGVRTMIGTSGGGFSLMTEGLGLAGITETPLVIVLGMRPGPASGMPTWTGQGDLLFAINASQDEFPRIVLTPGDPQEAFESAKLAQNLAEKYQLPIIILIDTYLAESYFTVAKFPQFHDNLRYHQAKISSSGNQTPFPRYQITHSGISPRTFPGQIGGVHLANSYEHDEQGFSTETSAARTKQVDKRRQKITSLMQDQLIVKPALFGPNHAAATLISWGSNKGILQTVINQTKNINFIHFPWVWPFPKQEFMNLIKSAQQLITVENNSTAQLNRLITQETGIKINNHILKYDGRPFTPDEIMQKLASKKYDL